jgi:enoyl-CoA hydratase/carnithine racemase
MEEKSLLYNVQGGVGLITINRPDQGNAITGEVTSLFD